MTDSTVESVNSGLRRPADSPSCRREPTASRRSAHARLGLRALRAHGVKHQAELGGRGRGPGPGLEQEPPGLVEEPGGPADQFDLHLAPRRRSAPGWRAWRGVRIASILIRERARYLVVGDLSQHLPGGI